MSKAESKMGPRGEHSREEFTALVVDKAQEIAAAEGLRGLGMRRIAAAIGYAPNSIYNAVGDLDDIILRLNARTLGRLHGELAGLVREKRSPKARVLRLADGYLDFVTAEPKLWSLLFDHVMGEDVDLPDWFVDALRRATDLVDSALIGLIEDAAERHRAVSALWAALHGLASLASSGKLGVVTRDDPRRLARLLIGGFLDGYGAQRPPAVAADQADA